MSMWKKFTQILGDIWSPLLIGAMLGTTMVLFIKLPMSRTNDSTLEESIFGKNESLELLLVLPDGEELHLKVTGRTTTEVVQSLQRMLRHMDGNLLLEKSSPSMGHQEGSIMKKHDNSFSMMS